MPLYYYAFSVLLGAFLLFQVEPMIGKYILPWFGGTPTVWSTVLLFFQVLLTGGYAYAYWLSGRMRKRWQGIVHLFSLGISLGLLSITALTWRSPIMPDAGWRPQSAELPIWGIVQILAVSVGIPYLMLSSNSTLMQAWFHREDASRSPYRLYVLSNIGSLVALVSYPVLFEPNLTLQAQGYLWSAGYVLFAIGSAYLALRTWRRATNDEAEVIPDSQPDEQQAPGKWMYILWIGLAACASALLISITSQITQEVAVIPFLWILPLTVYLLTFILAFSEGPWYLRRPYMVAYFIVAFVSYWMLVKWPPLDMTVQVIIYLLLLFICGMICHSELFKLRPHPRFLPSFYLMVAVGGAVGGIFVTLLAPYLFSSGFWELQWATIACGVLLTLVIQLERTPQVRLPRQQRRRKARQRDVPNQLTVKPIVLVSSVFLLLQLIAVVYITQAISTGVLLATRNFYGVLRVWELYPDKPKLRAYQLTHGKTVHGFQFADDVLRVLPTTFYAETSGVGLAILNHPARPGKLRIGVLGLGSGVLAAYGEPGDVISFYEINPDVVRIAQGEGGYFTFLKDSHAEIRIIPGDARVSLEREPANEDQAFDLLVLDAFSGDAVPLHLLTKEAFQIYLNHLKPNGIVAVNVSNRYFKLDAETFQMAQALGLDSALIEDKGDGIQSYDSVWMLLTRDPAFLRQPAIAARTAQRPPVPTNLAVWTDDFSNLLQVLR